MSRCAQGARPGIQSPSQEGRGGGLSRGPCVPAGLPTNPSGGSSLRALVEQEMRHGVVGVELRGQMQGEIARAEVAQVAIEVVLARIEVTDGDTLGLGAPAQGPGPPRPGLVGVAGDVELAQARRQDFALRVGLASGPLAAGSVGSSERQAFTVYGETVNRAARLETLGKDLNAAIIADTGVAETSDEIGMTLSGEHQLKGIPGSWPIWTWRPD